MLPVYVADLDSKANLDDTCVLQMGVLGMSFKVASLELREQVARAAESLSGEKGLFFRFPTVILSTCNRTEIYFGGPDLASIHSDLLTWLQPLIKDPFSYRLYSYFGIDCFTHLCRVTAGLDSAIVAETEIQRQVKVAYQQVARYLPSVFHYVFQKALRVGKQIRSQFPSCKGSATLFTTIWNLSTSFFSDLSSKNILFVGYSELNRHLLSCFMRRGIQRVTLCTRNPSLLLTTGYLVVGREKLKAWHSFDLIICASKADHYLIQGPGYKGRLIIDLSVPRNVDPRIGYTSELYNMEQINALIERQQKQQEEHVEQSEELLKQHVHRLARAYRDKQLL